jgi:hypothetical protein
MDFGLFFNTAWQGALRLSLVVFVILVPLMLILEFMRQTRALGWLTERVHPIAGRIGFQKEALVPLLAGFLFGISYGAGVLIPEARSRTISKQQVFLVAVFLALCHAVVEDTLLFMAVGANGLFLLGSRFLLAIAVTFLMAKAVKRFILQNLTDA